MCKTGRPDGGTKGAAEVCVLFPSADAILAGVTSWATAWNVYDGSERQDGCLDCGCRSLRREGGKWMDAE